MSVWRRVLVPWLWTGLLVPWTYGLLTPIPGETVERVGGVDRAYLISKSLHGGVYAALAMLTLALPFSRRSRLLLLAFVIAHGGMAEFLQQFVQRHNSWIDFGLDTVGVLVGAGLGWLGHRLFGPDLRAEASQIDLQRERSAEHSDAADLRQR